MIIVDAIKGNIKDPEWKTRLAGVAIDWLVLDQWEAQKNRFRKHSEGEIELAVALERNTRLQDGDILIWDEKARSVVAARIDLKEVMIVDLSEAAKEFPEQALRTCFELGHALGNQHWSAVVKDNRVFVPLTLDRKVISSVMRTHAFAGVRFEFAPGAEIIPYLAPHEARRLFGGADPTPHAHAHHDDQTHDG